MKQIMGCYHLHIERTQTVRKNSSVGNDRPLSLICLRRSSSFSEAGRPPGAPSRPHQRPWPRLCSSCRCSWSVTPLLSSCDDHTLLLRYALRFQSWIFLERKAQPEDLPPVDNRFSILPPSPAYIPGALPRIGVHTSFRQQCHLPLAHTPNRRTCPRMEH